MTVGNTAVWSEYEVKVFEMVWDEQMQKSSEQLLRRKAQASRDANLLHKEFPKELFK